jgi:nucleoside-diphosphate-sugar epimerase
MRWVLHGPMTSAVADALRRHGHAVESIDPKPKTPDELLKAAQQKQLDVLTTDASVVAAAKRFDRSIVFLQLAGSEVEQNDAIDRLFERYKRLSPGRIYTVTASRVKIRQISGAR